MKISEAYPSKTLKADDIQEDTTYTIREVQMEKLGSGDDADTKPVVYFEEVEKGFVLNKTNASTIEKLHGDDTDDWIGKKITLFATEVDFQGRQTMAIRVRMRKPAPRPAGRPAQAAARQPARKPAPQQSDEELILDEEGNPIEF